MRRSLASARDDKKEGRDDRQERRHAEPGVPRHPIF